MRMPVDTSKFHHNKTMFPLEGQHASVDCRGCHESLIFEEAQTECISCHVDLHQMTVGSDCARCHNSENWLVDNITELHQENGFPLIGVHSTVTCFECHTSETALRFDRIGNDCINCHLDEFQATTNPDHEDAGFSTNCIECHEMDNFDWGTETVDHSFFPLTKGHEVNDCAACHVASDFANTPTDCYECHQMDFEATTSPDHQAANFMTDCAACHTTDIGWMPAEYAAHDAEFFPIYSGAHEGTWDDCAACHTNSSDYKEFTCIACHVNPETDNVHIDKGVSGYVYENTACLACHPLGTADGSFDHDATNFPLTGAHIGVNCIDCHDNGFEGTPTDCAACHTVDFQGTTNPDHETLNLSTDCVSCHTTEPDWSPATFANHNDYYQLNGAHVAIANDCAECHINGDYNNTPNTCVGCHQGDYNATTNPNHQLEQYSTDCLQCHNEDTWTIPPTIDHDLFYPLTGAHQTIDDCTLCHINGNYSNTPTECVGCHQMDYDQSTNPNHPNLNIPTDCATCHTTNPGWTPASFPIHDDYYMLNGAHAMIANDCAECHINGDYNNTPNDCVGCHQMDYDQSSNPNHPNLNIPTDCATCHTTDPGWIPAGFPIHDDYHMLNGAHAMIANDCAACHINGDYNNTPNDCVDCHSDDYNLTTNPSHIDLQFSTNCIECHTESEWDPSTFDHDVQHFPIYSGAHDGEWNACVDCHTNPSNYEEFTCVNCHINPDTDDEHAGVNGYIYENTACLACHPTGNATNVFDHNATNFPLTGAHVGTDCIDCHSAGYVNTPTDCAACHQMDFTQTTNPNHVAIGLPTDCASCHTTDPGWMPADFPNHDDYYQLKGAHAAIANDCAACHNGDYNNTPNTCMGCHQDDYNATTSPNHQSEQFSTNCWECHNEDTWTPATLFDHNNVYPLTGAHETIEDDCILCHVNGNYNNTPSECVGCHQTDYDQSSNPNHPNLNIPTDCATCHTTEPDWMPAEFPIHDDYYALNGAHAMIADDCAACHNGDYNNTPNTCYGCHQSEYENSTNPNHASAQFSTDCTTCHTEDEWMPSTFDHDAQYFPIYSGAHDGEWDQCIDCHTNPNNYGEFSCTVCHLNPETDNAHVGIGGYSYNNPSCFACHPTGSADDNFDHDLTNFPLTGAHITTECIECHANGFFGTPTDCAACHQMDYDQTTNPDHEGIGISTDCESCHTTDPGWEPATFAIHNNYWVLDGAHVDVSDCADCHNGDYNNTPNTCVGCHQADYDQSTNPDHQALNLSTDCINCHTTDPDWMPAEFPDHDDYYQLNGAHALIANDCATCHNGNYNNTPNTCYGCHQTDYENTTDPDHQAAQFPHDCLQCHSEDAWIPSTFDHEVVYPLTGAHADIANDCALCHVNGNYNNTPNTCVGCHQADYDASTNPDHETLGLSTDCATCHTTDPDWMPAAFPDHDNYYQLNGAHTLIANDCAACHNGDYNNTPNTCYGCHQAEYENTTNPDHEALQFSTDCASCHSEDVWMPANFDHNAIYPLTGAHADIANDCNLCHINGNFNNTPNTCAGCHQDDYDQSTNPNHVSLGLSTDCETCHTTDPDWEPATFPIHDNYWVLDGEHLNVSNCADCHNGDYNNTPNTCVGCHQADYDQSTNPNHSAIGIPTTCETCHTTEADWEPATFPIHDNYWVLDGEHLNVPDCADCHNGDYNNTPNSCVGCHQADYDQSTNPNHSAIGIPTSCETCHTTVADWEPATFPIHDNYWVLDGEHLNVPDCADCHNGDYNNTPNTCVGCHQADYDQSTNPDHSAINIPTDCAMCHTTDPDWMPATFPIHDNYYVLNGAHAIIANDCALCHNGNYNNTPNTCFGCHEDDYNQATNPNHISAQFPTDCQICHSEDAWIPSTFDHNAIYPLTGAHQIIEDDCALCHVNGNFNNTPNTCEGCHTPDYNQSTNPNHVVLAIPTDCAMCHTTDPDWMPATFPIHDNYWPLNGAHANVNDCADCHNGDYNNTPNTCFGCHQSDYNNANNPDHVAAGFPTDCELCHDETAWTPSTFDHDNMYFPIYSGKHDEEWNLCIDCHIGGNYNSFSCIDCHEHDDPVDLADEHQGVPGYSYSSPACYSCHPTGEK